MIHIKFLKKAISILGIKPLACEIGVSYQAIQKYLKSRVPDTKVIPICKATNYQVTPHELRPDLYPHPQDGLPEHLRTAA